MTRILFPGMVVLGVSAFLAASLGSTSATQIKNDDIGGTVTSSAGPEAGVWVIAETNDLPTRYIKEVVTDDQGRYLIPGLAQGQVHRLGARLRIGGFAQGGDRARQTRGSETECRAGS